MVILRNDFLNAILDDGIHEIESNYLRLDQKAKREGGVAGFEVCRGKSDAELLVLHKYVDDQSSQGPWHKYALGSVERHWCFRFYELQIEWVLNVLSAGMKEQGRKPLTGFTLRGMLKAREILGVKIGTFSHG